MEEEEMMTDQEIYRLLIKIDNGYIPTGIEYRELEDIRKIEWESIDLLPKSLYLLKKVKKLSMKDCFEVSDISVLAYLDSLTFLKISQTTISENISRLRRIPIPHIEDGKSIVEPVIDISMLRELLNPLDLDSFSDLLKTTNKSSITDISALSSLSALTSLDISGTNVSDISALSGLSALTSLDISGTNVSDISALSGLSALTSLDISGTNVSNISALSGLTALASLDLRNTRVSDINALSGLSALTSLDISGTNVSDISALSGLSALTSLDISETDVSDISTLSNLTMLANFDLFCTGVNDINALSGLSALTSLDISETNVSDISALSGLSALTSLDISETNVSDISALSGLSALTSLDISGTNVSDISALSGLSALTSLDIGETDVSDISALSGLSALTSLVISGTNVSNISALSGLSALTSLYISETSVSDISALFGLTMLTDLILRDTRVSNISALSGLTALTYLDLSYTRVNDISVLSGLTNLTNLSLIGLRIQSIPDSLLDLEIPFFSKGYSEQPGIYIEGLTLINQPIEIFSLSRDLILAYYREQKPVPVNECKVIFLGDAEAGKTYSIKRMLDKGAYLKNYNGNSTPGIDITVSSVLMEESDVTVNYWDFGGQEIQHSMHRMFLTERTVYVVFLNARQDPLDDKARYWMENIKSFAPNAPVLIVINKMDQNDRPKFNEDGIRVAYKDNIKKIIRISALMDEPEVFMDELQGGIYAIIKELPIVKAKVPSSWKKLMDNIRSMPDHYISAAGFKERCSSCKILDYVKIHDDLVDLFQTIGVSFCYYKDRSLSDYMILNPKWLVNAVYTIVSNSNAVAKNGVISQGSLYDLLQNDVVNGFPVRRVNPELRYKGIEINYILGVIRMFQLSYPLKDGSEFFPMLCDGNEKIPMTEVVSENALHYVFRYTYLPANVMHRLIVDMQRDLDYRYVWYSGAVFENESHGQIAYVHTIGNNLHIYVESRDSYYNPNEYLTPIQSNVRSINQSMNLSAEEYITYREGEVEAVLSVDDVRGSLDNGIERVYNTKLKKVIELRDVVRRYEDTRPRIKGDLLPSILKALCNMQNEIAYHKNVENSHELEDRRNRYVASHISMKGIITNDQQPGGPGEGGKKAGKRDIVFRDKNGRDILIYEGLNLSGANNAYLETHLNKLLVNYNPQGLPYGVLTTYLDCDRDKFKVFTDCYKEHISQYAPNNSKCVGPPREIQTYGQLIRCMEMDYEDGGLYYTIYHIIVAMV